MEDTKGLAQWYRELFDIPEGEAIIVLKSPGFHGCPLAGDGGVTNCPQGFDFRGIPAGLEPWMRGLCQDGSWQQKWAEILACCQQCRGNPKPSSQQEQAWFRALDLLMEA